MNAQQIEAIRKTQAVLIAISNKQSVFFNITQYVNWGLVREHGTRSDNTTNWILTEKGKMIAQVVL